MKDKNKKINFFHEPVLVKEVVDYLITDLNGIYVDSTVGGGGHAEAILNKLGKKGKLIGVDRDLDAIKYSKEKFAGNNSKIELVQGDLGNIDKILYDCGVDYLDGFFLDLGISSYQIDTPERGFSYRFKGPLDMRMDRLSQLTAEYVINNYSEGELADLFYYYGEERYSRKIAKHITKERKKKSIETTSDLEIILRKITPSRYQLKTLSRVWQALRIEVNDEFGQLKKGLKKIYPLIKKGGHVVIISWESLTDRLIKHYFKGEALVFSRHDEDEISKTNFHYKILTKKVIKPSRSEIDTNKRSRSAKLRAAEKSDLLEI